MNFRRLGSFRATKLRRPSILSLRTSQEAGPEETVGSDKMAEGLGAAGVDVVLSGRDDDDDDDEVVTSQDDLMMVILRRKDSEPDELCVPSNSHKKNSFIKMAIDEEDWRDVPAAGNGPAEECPLCVGGGAACVGGGAAGVADMGGGAASVADMGSGAACVGGDAAGVADTGGDAASVGGGAAGVADTGGDAASVGGGAAGVADTGGGAASVGGDAAGVGGKAGGARKKSGTRKKKKKSLSSPVKSDRPYSGKGVPSRGFGTGITKSYSVESSAPPVPPHHLHHLHHHHNATHSIRRSQLQQAVSQSSGVGTSGRRQVPRGTAADDSGNRNSRWRGSGAQGNTQGYELSQDFADMRLEMLERRYGGVVARRAAITIQRAYRRYAMYKKFRSITATAKAQEKRLSRRFTVDVPEWSDSSGQQYHDTEHLIRSEFDQLHRNLSATVYGEGRRPARSLSMRDTPRTTVSVTASSTRQQQDPYDLHDALASMNDSSLYCHVSAQSPLTPTSTATPAPTHVRNGSGDYQGQQNDRDLKYFSSEDSGLGSQDGIGLNRIGVCGRRTMRGKKVPPEVPRRTSSIKSCESSGSNDRSVDNGSLSSVQSSGSDSSLSQSASDRATPLSTHDPVDNADYHPTSPIWKRKNQQMSTSDVICDDKRLSQISENSEDSLQSHSSEGMTYSQTMPSQTPHSARYAHAQYTHTPHMPKVPEVVRKRQYRVGLNLFNKKPERGVTYLIGRGFLENSPQAVAKFLLTRKGLSKQMIGEYLGNLQNNFNMAVLECFAHDIDLSGMQVDVALRKFQTHFRMPGEAQKIERLMQVFAQRYCQCNRDIVAKLRDPETIFVLAFAIIMLNTDLHTASMKQEKRMKIDDFVKNLRGIDDGYDIEREMLEGMYQRIKSQEFRPGHDHVTQVLKVQQTMVGKKPNLALPHRRLVCYCRLYEIPDISKKERVGVHQREVFLFNDLLVVTKIFSKKKSSVTYTFRQSFPLAGLAVSTKEVAHYPYLMEIRHRVDNKVLIIFNARNEHDRSKFCEDLKESVCEMDEMESLRIEGELERQKASLRASRPSSTAENRDSGVADMELLTTNEKNGTLKPDSTLKRSALSNSLLDIHEAEGVGQTVRRGSVGSLDSGMSVSFQSTSASNDTSPASGPSGGIHQSLMSSASHGDLQHHLQRRTMASNSSFLGQLFRPRRVSRTELNTTGVEV
ncbi:IQ motif and SEC7 domain-containing protein 1 isoform X8 [Procambarus clarkii]|uniref:IQ motif and SEC7 domain-containing protein 1 isoform X8 n=1 Tax=Procambarus clarkii TaxID=6728 RepID=UPI0037448E3B